MLKMRYFYLMEKTRPMRGGFSRYIGLEPGEPRRGLWISEGPTKQETPCYINWLCVSLSCIKYMYMLSGHSAAQEIKHLWKVTSGFIGPQILNY